MSFGENGGLAGDHLAERRLRNLNDLVEIGPDVLLSAQDINDDGVITGRVRDGVTGEVKMLIATPTAQPTAPGR